MITKIVDHCALMQKYYNGTMVGIKDGYAWIPVRMAEYNRNPVNKGNIVGKLKRIITEMNDRHEVESD